MTSLNVPICNQVLGFTSTSGSSANYVSGGFAQSSSGNVIKMPGFHQISASNITSSMPDTMPYHLISRPTSHPTSHTPQHTLSLSPSLPKSIGLVLNPPTGSPIGIVLQSHVIGSPIGSSHHMGSPIGPLIGPSHHMSPPIGPSHHMGSQIGPSHHISPPHHLTSKHIISSNGSHLTHSGAGVILMEIYNGKLAFTMYNNQSTGRYDCPGGKIDNPTLSLEQTAVKELREESLNMFNVDPRYLGPFVDISAGHKMYRGYLLFIQGPIDKRGAHPLFSEVYYQNKKILSTSNFSPHTRPPHSWSETNDIARVYVGQFIEDLKSGHHNNLLTTDAKGRSIIINGRDVKLIIAAINSGLIDQRTCTTSLTVHTMRWATIRHSSKRFLVGTNSYEL